MRLDVRLNFVLFLSFILCGSQAFGAFAAVHAFRKFSNQLPNRGGGIDGQRFNNRSAFPLKPLSFASGGVGDDSYSRIETVKPAGARWFGRSPSVEVGDFWQSAETAENTACFPAFSNRELYPAGFQTAYQTDDNKKEIEAAIAAAREFGGIESTFEVPSEQGAAIDGDLRQNLSVAGSILGGQSARDPFFRDQRNGQLGLRGSIGRNSFEGASSFFPGENSISGDLRIPESLLQQVVGGVLRKASGGSALTYEEISVLRALLQQVMQQEEARGWARMKKVARGSAVSLPVVNAIGNANSGNRSALAVLSSNSDSRELALDLAPIAQSQVHSSSLVTRWNGGISGRLVVKDACFSVAQSTLACVGGVPAGARRIATLEVGAGFFDVLRDMNDILRNTKMKDFCRIIGGFADSARYVGRDSEVNLIELKDAEMKDGSHPADESFPISFLGSDCRNILGAGRRAAQSAVEVDEVDLLAVQRNIIDVAIVTLGDILSRGALEALTEQDILVTRILFMLLNKCGLLSCKLDNEMKLGTHLEGENLVAFYSKGQRCLVLRGANLSVYDLADAGVNQGAADLFLPRQAALSYVEVNQGGAREQVIPVFGPQVAPGADQEIKLTPGLKRLRDGIEDYCAQRVVERALKGLPVYNLAGGQGEAVFLLDVNQDEVPGQEASNIYSDMDVLDSIEDAGAASQHRVAAIFKKYDRPMRCLDGKRNLSITKQTQERYPAGLYYLNGKGLTIILTEDKGLAVLNNQQPLLLTRDGAVPPSEMLGQGGLHAGTEPGEGSDEDSDERPENVQSARKVWVERCVTAVGGLVALVSASYLGYLGTGSRVEQDTPSGQAANGVSGQNKNLTVGVESLEKIAVETGSVGEVKKAIATKIVEGLGQSKKLAGATHQTVANQEKLAATGLGVGLISHRTTLDAIKGTALASVLTAGMLKLFHYCYLQYKKNMALIQRNGINKHDIKNQITQKAQMWAQKAFYFAQQHKKLTMAGAGSLAFAGFCFLQNR